MKVYLDVNGTLVNTSTLVDHRVLIKALKIFGLTKVSLVSAINQDPGKKLINFLKEKEIIVENVFTPLELESFLIREAEETNSIFIVTSEKEKMPLTNYPGVFTLAPPQGYGFENEQVYIPLYDFILQLMDHLKRLPGFDRSLKLIHDQAYIIACILKQETKALDLHRMGYVFASLANCETEKEFHEKCIMKIIERHHSEIDELSSKPKNFPEYLQKLEEIDQIITQTKACITAHITLANAIQKLKSDLPSAFQKSAYAFAARFINTAIKPSIFDDALLAFNNSIASFKSINDPIFTQRCHAVFDGVIDECESDLLKRALNQSRSRVIGIAPVASLKL